MNIAAIEPDRTVPHCGIDLRADYFSATLDAIPLAMAVLDETARIAIVNAPLLALFDVDRTALIGNPVSSLLSNAVPVRWLNSELRSVADGVQATHEVEAARADGTSFPVEMNLSTMNTSEGRRVTVSIRDISERKRQRNNFRTVFQSAPYGMLMIDAEGVIKVANAAAIRIFGYSGPELEGRPIEILLPERHRIRGKTFRSRFTFESSSSRTFRRRDLLGLHRDGFEMPLEVGLSHVETAKGPRYVVSLVELGKRKALEAELRHANANLEEFTYVASHDLKSPLRGLADLMSWIEEDIAAGDSEKVTHNLGRVRVRIERLEQIVTDLLHYARAGQRSTDYEKIELTPFLAQIVEVQPHPPGFTITARSDVAELTAVKTPLETVLRNLLSNAVNHHHRDDGRIEISVRAEEDYCVFRVSDDGPGIPSNAQERVFKLFQTMTNSERSGGGLGLALAKRLVEAHDGRITLESAGRGSDFEVWWPRFQRRIVSEGK